MGRVVGNDRFQFFEKRTFRFENNKEKTKNETMLFKNDLFSFYKIGLY